MDFESSTYDSSGIDSSAEELKLLERLRAGYQHMDEQEKSLKQQIYRYQDEVAQLRSHVPSGSTHIQDQSSISDINSVSSEVSTDALLQKIDHNIVPVYESGTSLCDHVIRSKKPTRTDFHREFVADLERFSKVKCTEADRILKYLKTGKKYRIEATFNSSEASDLFRKMSSEITRLSSEKAETEAKLDHVLSLVKRYTEEHKKKKSEKELLLSRLREAEQETRDIYQFISDLFPQFSNGQTVSRENAKSVLVAVAKCLK